MDGVRIGKSIPGGFGLSAEPTPRRTTNAEDPDLFRPRTRSPELPCIPGSSESRSEAMVVTDSNEASRFQFTKLLPSITASVMGPVPKYVGAALVTGRECSSALGLLAPASATTGEKKATRRKRKPPIFVTITLFERR